VKKTKTQAFSNFIGGLIFLAAGIWAYIQTTTFQVMVQFSSIRRFFC